MTDALRAITFSCHGERLPGIVHGRDAKRGVGAVIIVGGPQYRAGSHRQFVHLARALAADGVPTLRFDYRGMGDADGEFQGFERVDADVRAAVDALVDHVNGVRDVMLIGLCDAASAAWMYAPGDPRVTRLVVFNPWVRSEASHARTQVRHYYLKRIASPELWRKVFGGGFDWRGSLRSLAATLAALGARGGGGGDTHSDADVPYQERMLRGAEAFTGNTLLILSGEDMTAQEFSDLAQASARWQAVFARASVTTQAMPEANHTFSCERWRDDVAARALAWLKDH